LPDSTVVPRPRGREPAVGRKQPDVPQLGGPGADGRPARSGAEHQAASAAPSRHTLRDAGAAEPACAGCARKHLRDQRLALLGRHPLQPGSAQEGRIADDEVRREAHSPGGPLPEALEERARTMRVAIRKHLGDFLAVIAVFVLALGTAAYILSN